MPLNFPDALFLDDMDPMGGEIESDLQGFKQDVLHLLKQAIGSNDDDPSKGADVADAMSAPIARLRAAAAEVDVQLAEDDRCDGSTTTVSVSTVPGFDFDIDVEVQVDGSILDLSFAYSTTEGVIAQ